jgi:environmental stress-induced protein Ves
MNARPTVGSLRCFSIDTLPREAWKNGGGWTRTVASHDADHLLRWRVSVADITAAGPFSRFDGLDRTAVMVRGTGLCLIGDAQAWHFDGPGSFAKFPGELALHCDAPVVPTQLWNVMVRRGQAQAKLLIVENDAVDLAPAPDVLVLVLRGRFELVLPGADSLVLNALDCLHLPGLTVMARITPLGANNLLLVTTLS